MPQMKSRKHDVIIIGGGPGGAAGAMFLAREGIRPLIIEHKTFPCYHIGESMTGKRVLRQRLYLHLGRPPLY